MNRIADFWKGKSEAERRKILVYSIAGIVCVLLVVIVIALNTKPIENEVSDFSNPDAKEVEKYNSRTEANQLGKKDSSDLNVAMDDIFGQSQNAPITEAPTAYYEPTYSTSNNNEYQQPTYSSPSNGGSGNGSKNSHSTYGDYSMWQAEEPKNNSVGYTNKKGVPTKKQNAEPDYTEIPTPTYQSQSQPQTKDISEGKQVRAKLISQGYATSGRSLSFVLLDATKINGENVAKGQVVTGIASEENNRLMVNFSTIKVKNKIVPVQMQLLGSDGMAGLPVGGNNSNNLGNEAGNRGKDMARQQVNRIPVIGGLVGSAIGGGNRTSDNKIKLSNNIECIIVHYN